MAVYWIMFILPLLVFSISAKISSDLKLLFFIFFFFLFVVLIGFRFEVGGDWFTYIALFENYKLPDQQTAIGAVRVLTSNFLYDKLVETAFRFNLGMTFVNFSCGFFLVSGVIIFCYQQRNSFLALSISVPYLLIVVGMGYTRQSAAIGFVLLAITALEKNRALRFLVLIFLGALFHKSCLLVAPFAIYGLAEKNRGGLLISIVVAFAALIGLSIDSLLSVTGNYLNESVRGSQDSRGALVRIVLCIVPASIILLWPNVILRESPARKFWVTYSFVPFLALPLAFYASNLADRLILYSIPLQIYVFSKIDLLFKDFINKNIFIMMVLFLYFSTHYVWLNFSYHSKHWVPYEIKISYK